MKSVIRRNILRTLHLIYERLVLSWKIGKGVADVDFSSFGSTKASDISDHLHLLNLLTHLIGPKVIVELGTRGGESTRVFVRYVNKNQCEGIGVDLSPKPNWMKRSDRWKHFVSDDCILGETLSVSGHWPDGKQLRPIDLLFIDTSHEYSHTVRELGIWRPLVRKSGWIIFHDTNLSKEPSRRLSGGINYGWNNSRGVTRAIEEHFKIQIEEKRFFSSDLNGLASFIFHVPWNNGLTAIRIK